MSYTNCRYGEMMDKKKLFWYIVLIEIIVELLLLGLIFGVSRIKNNNIGTINIDNSNGKNDSINKERKSDDSKDNNNSNDKSSENNTSQDKSFIKWVDFKVSSEALKDACFYNVESYYSGNNN